MNRAGSGAVADVVLRGYFARERAAAGGRRLERLCAAEADLRACLEVLAPVALTGPELALLALERQFEAEGAAARVAAADAVLIVLPTYLEDPRWRGADLEDRRLRITLAEPLAWSIARLPQLRGTSLGCPVWTIEAAARHARWVLRQEREAARRA